jgi:hypothetical protein
LHGRNGEVRVACTASHHRRLTDHRGKTREKMLERELAKLAGENWQVRV